MQGFIGVDLEEIVAYCKEELCENVAEVLKTAEDVTNYSFLFQSKWELERTYKPVVYEDKKVLWDKIPFGDAEWVFAMNRHRCFITLSHAYAFTKDEKYTECFIDLLTQWITYNPLTQEMQATTWRTIEAGLRCENWLKAHEIFKTSPLWHEALEKLFQDTLEIHADYIMSQYNDFKRMSNWGIIENHGLFLVGVLLPNLKGSNSYIETASKRLETAMTRQIMSDGCHWEQSQCYHNEVLRAFIDVAICAKNNQVVLNDVFHECIQKMLDVTIYMARPNHIQLANGDSDEIDVRDLLVRAAYLYEKEHFKALGYEKVDFESIWDIGIKGKETYEQLAKTFPKEVNKALEEAGHYCLRDSWGEEASFLHFKCGNLGGGHGHADLLHFDLAYNGEDILIDKGRYTYVDSKERYYLKSGQAHNTILVDNKAFTEVKDTWAYEKIAQPMQRKCILQEDVTLLEGAHLGYMDLQDPLLVNRKIVYIKPNIIIVADECYAKEVHEYTQYFHFAKGNLSLEEGVVYTGEKTQLTMYHVEKLEKEKIKTISSKYYNHLEETPSLVVHKKGKGFTSIMTVLVLQDKNNYKKVEVEKVPVHTASGECVQDEAVEGLKISYGETTYFVTIKHNEIISQKHLLDIGGHDVYGRVTVTEVGEKTKYHKFL